MVTIWDVFANGLWIIGLAIILAVWSYGRFTASRNGIPTKQKMISLKYALVMNGGLLLFLCGMVLTEDRWWSKLIWGVMGILVLVESGLRIQQNKKNKVSNDGQDNSSAA
ncbi:MAG: hypothetical protein P1S60_08390 [Anaerolineae bacterium]|nr:hypothetical protein [Anaerolineae bacterium]